MTAAVAALLVVQILTLVVQFIALLALAVTAGGINRLLTLFDELARRPK